MPGHLNGKVVVLTGAYKGLGAAIARRSAAEGGSLVVNYADSVDAADRMLADIEAGGRGAFASRPTCAISQRSRRLCRDEPRPKWRHGSRDGPFSAIASSAQARPSKATSRRSAGRATRRSAHMTSSSIPKGSGKPSS